MKKFLLWIPSIPFLLSFGLILVVFHVLQVIALRMGYLPHKKVVDAMVFCINRNLLWLFAPIQFKNLAGELPTDQPMIIVSNHQGMFDIPAIGEILRKHHTKYVAKKSLAYGIPAISYNIRHGGCVYIDRDKPAEALEIIKDFCEYLNENNRSGVIFPEGTRSRDGSMRPFKKGGLSKMLDHMPNATIVPVAIENFWKLEQYKLKPMPFNVRPKCTVLPPISREGKTNVELVEESERVIRAALNLEN